MKVVTADEMRELDRRTIQEVGIPGAVLMENAGRGAARVLLENFRDFSRGPVAVVCGAGNNAGDGFVVARVLAEKRVAVQALLLAAPERLQGDARLYFEVMRKLDVPFRSVGASGVDAGVLGEWKAASCIVDAIFGTGLSREAEGLFRSAIEGIQSCRRPVLALDIPSGIQADTGRVLGAAVKADWTATFGLPKRGLFLHPGASYAGRVECVDIGIPRLLVEAIGLEDELLEPDCLLGALRRDPDTHKGTYGHLLVVAGSAGKTGAAFLCSEAALRCGAGLVTLGIPEALNPIFEQKLTEVMTLPLAGTHEGGLSHAALERIVEFAGSVDGVAVGPGLGITEDTERIIRALWLEIEKPMVWDADALTLLARNPDLCGKQRGEVVLTPHPGEMGRLLGKPASWVQANRVEAVKSVSRTWRVTTVLKGARTLISDPRERLRINPTGNAGMASGGMGDVLTGMIGGLMLQGMSAFDAASLGVWLHGAAGDEVARGYGPLGFLASELMQAVPRLYQRLGKKDG